MNYKKQIEKNACKKTSMYFLSQDNMNGKTLTPRIPDNYFTRNGYEDSETKRVCFAPSINKSLMALSQKCNDMELYIHVPNNMDDVEVKNPSQKEVPDSKITKEIWSLNPTKIKCIGKIRVTGDAGKDGRKFKYGDKESELYDWKYKHIKIKE